MHDYEEDGGSWPLIDREEELQAVETALAAGRAGIVLAGANGVGKTRLARDALARWAAAGGRHAWVKATRAAGTIPFGAVSHLLATLGAAPEADPIELMMRAARRLSPGDGQTRLIVGVDDAHFLDEQSAATLHQLAVIGLLAPVMTVRTGEPVCDAVVSLWKEDGRWISVEPLRNDAVDRLIDHALRGPVDQITRRRLRQMAAGNPLMLRELLVDLRTSGALARREDIWHWRGAVPCGARLTELIASQLRALDGQARAALEVIACGEPVPLGVLRRLVSPAAIEAAERSGMAVADRTGARVAFRLAHPLYGELLRTRNPVSRTREIWSDLADALADGPMRRREDALVAGVWELHSGMVKRPGLLLEAARTALAQFDLNLAERLARAVIGTVLAPDGELLLARILQYRGRGEEAAAALPSDPPSDRDYQVLWADTRALILCWGLGRAEEAERALLPSDVTDARQDQTEASRSWVLLFDGRCREALQVAHAVLELPDASTQAVIWAAMSGTAAAGLLGRLDLARTIIQRGQSMAGPQLEEYPWGQAQMSYGLCLALHANGLVREAVELAEAGYRAAIARGFPSMAGMWVAYHGLAANRQGRLAEAQAALREAIALLEDLDTYHMRRLYLAELAGSMALEGDARAAENYMIRSDLMRNGANRLFDAWIEVNRAWVVAADGDRSAGAKHALRAADLARATEQPTIEAVCLYDAARLGAAAAVHERLTNVAKTVDGPLAAVLASAATALATGDATELELAAGWFAEHGNQLLAAEALADAANVCQRQGRLAKAGHLRVRARQLIDCCSGVKTRLLNLDCLAADLTPREREIALLAVSLSSPQIAGRLQLSVRTVDNHLSRAYAKLGVTNRRQLRSLKSVMPNLIRHAIARDS